MILPAAYQHPRLDLLGERVLPSAAWNPHPERVPLASDPSHVRLWDEPTPRTPLDELWQVDVREERVFVGTADPIVIDTPLWGGGLWEGSNAATWSPIRVGGWNDSAVSGDAGLSFGQRLWDDAPAVLSFPVSATSDWAVAA